MFVKSRGGVGVDMLYDGYKTISTGQQLIVQRPLTRQADRFEMMMSFHGLGFSYL